MNPESHGSYPPIPDYQPPEYPPDGTVPPGTHQPYPPISMAEEVREAIRELDKLDAKIREIHDTPLEQDSQNRPERLARLYQQREGINRQLPGIFSLTEPQKPENPDNDVTDKKPAPPSSPDAESQPADPENDSQDIQDMRKKMKQMRVHTSSLPINQEPDRQPPAESLLTLTDQEAEEIIRITGKIRNDRDNWEL